MRMTRRLFSILFLTLVLGSAGLQVACSDSQSKTESNDTAAEDQASADAKSEGETQVAAAESADDADAKASDDSDAKTDSDKPYDVSCSDGDCKAGEAVVTGYEKYHAHCHQCHGPNGVGSSFAPSLVKRLKDMEQGEFAGIVANGQKRFDSTTGGYSVMPAWKDEKDVMSNMNQLWAYLKARADGALSSGEPEPK